MSKAFSYQDFRRGEGGTMCPPPPPGAWSDKNTTGQIGLISHSDNLDKLFEMLEKIECLFELCTAQRMKFSIKDFFSKCDQIHSFLQIWSHFLKISLMENFIFCAVLLQKHSKHWDFLW